MNTNNPAKCVSAVRRNLHRKNIDLRPLRLSSLLGLIMGVLMLMAMAAPSAHAELLAYWNFNDPAPDFASDDDGTGGQTGILIQNGDGTVSGGNPFPTSSGPNGGHFNTDGVDADPVNKALGDTSTGLHSLDVGGNTSTMGGTGMFCFTTQAINTNGQFLIDVSFALESVGNNHQFSELKLSYSTTSQTSGFTQFADIIITSGSGGSFHNNFVTFQTTGGSFNLTPGTTTFYLQFCFFNQTDNADPNHTYIDNIQVNGRVPEPTTAISGVLAAVGLFWCHRKRLSAVLRARLA
jgi:hypothetical protein